MKKQMILIPILAALILAWGNGPVQAQGFSSILKKLDLLEQRLDQLERTQIDPLKERLEQLEVVQGENFAQLQSQLVQGSETPDLSGVDDSINHMRTRLDHLTTTLEEHQTRTSQSTDVRTVQGLATDLRALTGELRTALESATLAQNEIPGLTLSGFVDASYGYDVASEDNSFGLDQIEVNVEKSIGELGLVHADLEWVSDGEGGFALDAEQGYVTFQPAFLGPRTLTFGKFNAPIGFELLDAPDMYQFSHALVFDYGLPTNLSGAMLSAPLGPHFDGTLYVSNGWDENVDGNSGKTAGGRLGFSQGEGGAGLSIIHGTESAGNRLTVVDVDLTATPAEKWTLGGEFNYGRSKADSTTSKWQGFLLMGHVDLSAWGGITLRYDFFDDGDASRLGSGLGEKRQAFTVSPTFALGDGMGALVEFRTDLSDQKVFIDSKGQPAKSTSGLAFEMTYTF